MCLWGKTCSVVDTLLHGRQNPRIRALHRKSPKLQSFTRLLYVSNARKAGGFWVVGFRDSSGSEKTVDLM